MRFILKFITVTVFLLATTSSYATHIMGGEITYEYLGGKKYEVSITIYRDCRGITLSSVPLGIRCTSTGQTINTTPIRQSISEITPLCKSVPLRCNPQNARSGEGIEKHIYAVTIDFDNAPYSPLYSCASRLQFFSSIPARNGAINTGPQGTFYVETEIDLKKAPNNSSPTFSLDPIALLCCNQPARLSTNARDADGDSLSFDWTPPLRGPNQQLSYSGTNYAYDHPFMAFYPGTLRPPYNNINANPPIGIHLDQTTGDITFTPTRCDEVTVASLRATEWRKNTSGIYEEISFVKRDVQVITKSCPDNNPPKVTSPLKHTFDINGCVQNFSLIIDATDNVFIPPPPSLPPPVDTTRFLVPSNWPDGISYEILDSSSLRPKLRVLINNEYLDSKNYQAHELKLGFEVRDDACPLNGATQRTLTITFRKLPENNTATLKGSIIDDLNTDCSFDSNEDTLSLRREIMVKDSLQVYYATSNADGTFEFCLKPDTIDIQLSPSPWFENDCGDSSFNAKSDSTYDITLYSKLKDGAYGYIYKDFDTSCIKTSSSIPLRGQLLILEPGSHFVTTDKDGLYLFSGLANGDYTIKPVIGLDSTFKPFCGDSIKFTYTGSAQKLDDYLLTKDLKIDPFVSVQADYNPVLFRGRSQSIFYPIFGLDNLDSLNLYAQLPSGITLSSNNNIWKDEGNGLYKTSYFKTGSRPTFTFNLFADPITYKSGDTAQITYYIDTLATDSNVKNNHVVVDYRVLAPYDPNRKTTREDSIFTVDNRNLEYTITFQNTGSAPAQKVVVRDTLPEVLDISKIEFLSASHDYYPLMDNRKIWFVFDDIYLPDSTSDRSGSIGSVTFRVPISDTIYEDTYVRNRASIYFDFEEPIVTPTKINLFKSPTKLYSDKDVYCINDLLKVEFISHFTPDAGNQFYLEVTDSSGSDLSFHKIDSISTSDTFGSFSIGLDTSWLPSKNYLLRIRSSAYPSLSFVSYYDTIEVLEQNILTLSTSELNICSGEAVSISPSWNGIKQSWYLNGDSMADNSPLQSDSIKNLDKIYSVQLDNNGCISTSDTLIFNVSNRAILTYVGDTATCGNSVDLDIATRHIIGGNGIGDLDSMFYNLGDGTLLKENDAANIPYTYAIGKYDVEIISKTEGNCYDTLLQTITIGADPNAGFTASLDTICIGESIAFIDTSKSIHSRDINQSFFIDQNLLTSNKDAITHTFVTTGDFSVKLKLTDEFGCADSAQKAIAVGASSTSEINTADTSFCEDELPVTLSSSSSGQDKLIWNLDGMTYSTQVINLSPDIGSHNVQLIAKNAFCSDTSSQIIRVENITSATFQITAEYCQNRPILWAADSIEAGTNYKWTIDGVTFTGSEVNQALTNLGSATIQLITEITAGCNDTNSVTTSVIPTGDTGMQIENICFGEPLQIINTSSTTEALFDYDFGDGNTLRDQNFQAIQTHNYAAAGTYTITQISKIAPCSDTLSQVVTVYPLPNASFSATNDLTTERTVRISNNSLGASSFDWSFGDGNKSAEGGATLYHTYEKAGSYEIYLKVVSDAGCADSTQVSFSLLDDITFHIPTSFSPNNDGVNDTYNILPSEFIKSLEMKLYNRWGELVVKSNETLDILPNLEQGYYAYVLTIVDITGRMHQSKGTLTVLR